MQEQTARQQGRARARQARVKVREEQVQRERRLARLGERVAVAVAERDAVVADCEQRTGRALRSMVKDEGLSTREALAWCGDEALTAREVYRLIRDAEAGGESAQGEQGLVCGAPLPCVSGAPVPGRG